LLKLEDIDATMRYSAPPLYFFCMDILFFIIFSLLPLIILHTILALIFISLRHYFAHFIFIYCTLAASH